jgi:spermidine/putrescine transport system permease protein
VRIGTRSLASPALVFIAVMVGGPMAVIVWYSFRTRGPGGVGVGDGLTTDAYERLTVTEDFAGNVGFEPTCLDVMWSSILLAAATMLIALVIGFPTAVWISNRPRHIQPMLILAVTIPFWTSMLVRTYAWIVILRETGPLASALDTIGIDAPQMLNTRGATLVGMAYTFLPFMVLPIYAAAERLTIAPQRRDSTWVPPRPLSCGGSCGHQYVPA